MNDVVSLAFTPGVNSAIHELEQALRRQLSINETDSDGEATYAYNQQEQSDSNEDTDGDYMTEEETENFQDMENLPGDVSARVDVQPFIKWLELAIPFFILFCAYFIYQHRVALICFVWLTAHLFNANEYLKGQVQLKQDRQVRGTLFIVGMLVFHIVLFYFIFEEDQLWRSLVFYPPLVITFSNSIWVIVMNDLMVRFGTMLIKGIAIVLIGHVPPFKRKAQLYATIESASSLYRCLLPIPVWFIYFVGNKEDQFFSAAIGGVYLVFKIAGVSSSLSQFLYSAKSYLLHEVRFGKHASKEQVMESGDMCPICREKMTDPISLKCNHIFCEDCVSKWFEREKTCPLCRCIVHTAGQPTHSDGSTSLMVSLF